MENTRRKIKLTITVYSNGDSNDLATWSNVPYLFCRALEKRGIKINRVNIEANKVLQKIFNAPLYYIFRKLLRLKASPEYNRSLFHRFFIERKIRKSNELYPDSDFNLFLTYAFYNKWSNKPNVLWCDWTDRISIERMGRSPQWYENGSLKYEDNVMKNASMVYTMFPVCKERMENFYGREIKYLNRNVINTLYDKPFKNEENVIRRFKSSNVLFIGNHRYKGAAQELIKSFNELKRKYPELHLDVIGMTSNELKEVSLAEDITCHGYLNKTDPCQRDKYYELLLNAHVLVNPARKWGGYSSTVEAMYYGCPVLIAPYADFVKEFGDKIDFGIYLDGSERLTDALDKIISMSQEEYCIMSNNASRRVASYTWDNYVDDFLADLERSGKLKYNSSK